MEAKNDDLGESSSKGSDLHRDIVHRDDLEGREENEVFEEEIRKKDEEIKEKRDEVEIEKEKRVLDQEERWKKIQERRAFD